MGNTELFPVQLDNDTIMYIEVRDTGGIQNVSGSNQVNLEAFSKTVELFGARIHESLKKIAPHKASIEFGLKSAIKSGQLVTLLCDGSSEANIKVTLEWHKQG